MNTRESVITLRDVCYNYTNSEDIEIPALNGVSLEIYEGEFIAIIGHNGSGKSTLAKLINALLIPHDGEVWIRGMNTKDEDKLWDIRQTAGMVFQNPDNQIVATIVEEDVAFGPENLGIPSKEICKRVNEALKSVEMYEHAKKPPHYLSGGQKQRIAIAGIIAMKPQIIVLDEPTAMLDPIGRKEVMNTVKKLNKEGITVVHITHFMEEAVGSDRVYVMEDGKILTYGTPSNIFSQVELLKKAGLDVPQITELAYELKSEGIDIPLGLTNVDEMVDLLCQLKSKN